jgi:hypothetical protein
MPAGYKRLKRKEMGVPIAAECRKFSALKEIAETKKERKGQGSELGVSQRGTCRISERRGKWDLDQVTEQGVRLPHFKFPRNPTN